MVGAEGAAGNVICSICYEDLKPAVEDLQAISVCGHVFHELCLQQWFEYCTNKKTSCPVCKQSCTNKQAGRLYFQSVGDQADINVSQKIRSGHECPELQNEVKRLGLKVSALTSTVEHQQKSLTDVNEELCCFKDLAKKESALKVEALHQQALLQQSLQCKSEDLSRSTAACLKLQERNMALAKELAAIKLVTDLDLKEDDALKLASLGNRGNLQDTIDILRKSLVIRNKSYKELMVKCNLLGRGEARSNVKLEKAVEKISKLQTRVQQLEKVIEDKENDTMRAVLKASCISVHKMDVQDKVDPSPKKKKLSDSSGNEFCEEQTGTVENGLLDRKDECVYGSEGTSINSKEGKTFIMVEDDNDNIGIGDGKDKSDLSELSLLSREMPCNKNRTLLKDSYALIEKNEHNNLVYCPDKDDAPVEPLVHVRNETSRSAMPPQPANDQHQLNLGGLLGPDGLSRSLGKWCKKGQAVDSNSVSFGMQGGTKSVTGNLIAVGADGRGGKIKILKSLHQPLDTRGSLTSAKRQKQGTKTTGCLQIEHFFGKSG